MDWTGGALNGAIVTLALMILAFAIKRWISHVETKLGDIVDRINKLELSLVQNYVPKGDFEAQREHNSGSHKNIWEEFRKFQDNIRDRVTVVETLIDKRKPRRAPGS